MLKPVATTFAVVLFFAVLPRSSGASEWRAASGFRSAELPVPATGKTGFTRLPPSLTGITFTNYLSDIKAAENQIRLSGSGVALGDVDGDGLCDIYFCQMEGPNALYRNLGNWRFEDVTASAGVACEGQYSTGAALVDVDGDGALDLLVNALGGGTRLFLNDGKGHFHVDGAGGHRRRWSARPLCRQLSHDDGAQHRPGHVEYQRKKGAQA
ncbi:MAG: hypothetical protein DME19_16845 [Verrucomicrobia bacterium]|nr:MAG: hypothetical protein DME19_16845 [Verrucomicrobiota bacterium]